MHRAIPALVLFSCMCVTASGQQPQQQFQGAVPGAQQQFGTGGQQYGPYDQYWQYANPNSFMPNIYNPATQPLSPYLLGTNSLNNPAVGYYFGTRPGTIGMGQRGMGGAPFMAMGGARTLFFPQLAYAPEPFGEAGEAGPPNVLPPAGHQTVFNNTLGYYPSPFGANGGRGGLAGLGAQGQKK